MDNDYYDSDEDTYFDRTGQIEKSREKRRQRALVSYISLFSFSICYFPEQEGDLCLRRS